MTRLIWDVGTAYDFFLSLYVLYHPEDYGLRRAWAAGVRSRLPATERDLLGDLFDFLAFPLGWVHQLPAPRDGAAVLRAFEALAPSRRLEALCTPTSRHDEMPAILGAVATRGDWGPDDVEALRALYERYEQKPPRKKRLTRFLDLWAGAEATSERLLAAFRAYYEEFFAEEEDRIRPVLEDAAAQAVDLAGRVDLPELLDRLGQGVRFADARDVPELVLAPSFWITPLIVMAPLGESRQLFVFGARPVGMSLIPGELVPDGLYHGLKALADPTRLRILHYLSQSPMTPADLARRLRLRPPTVTHHLQTLRIAGLVRLSIEPGGRRLYAARAEAIAGNYEALRAFLDDAAVPGDGPPADGT